MSGEIQSHYGVIEYARMKLRAYGYDVGQQRAAADGAGSFWTVRRKSVKDMNTVVPYRLPVSIDWLDKKCVIIGCSEDSGEAWSRKH